MAGRAAKALARGARLLWCNRFADGPRGRHGLVPDRSDENPVLECGVERRIAVPLLGVPMLLASRRDQKGVFVATSLQRLLTVTTFVTAGAVGAMFFARAGPGRPRAPIKGLGCPRRCLAPPKKIRRRGPTVPILSRDSAPPSARTSFDNVVARARAPVGPPVKRWHKLGAAPLISHSTPFYAAVKLLLPSPPLRPS